MILKHKNTMSSCCSCQDARWVGKVAWWEGCSGHVSRPRRRAPTAGWCTLHLWPAARPLWCPLCHCSLFSSQSNVHRLSPVSHSLVQVFQGCRPVGRKNTGWVIIWGKHGCYSVKCPKNDRLELYIEDNAITNVSIFKSVSIIQYLTVTKTRKQQNMCINRTENDFGTFLFSSKTNTMSMLHIKYFKKGNIKGNLKPLEL